MLRFAADENFNSKVVRGLLRRLPNVDVVRVQDIEGLVGADDPTVLEWAARQRRILLTHDVATMTRYAWERVSRSLPMPGIIEINPDVGIGPAVESLVLLIEAGRAEDLEAQVLYLPF